MLAWLGFDDASLEAPSSESFAFDVSLSHLSRFGGGIEMICHQNYINKVKIKIQI
jgi:hypothetical protein